MTEKQTHILYIVEELGIHCLIPKKRGTGFLKQPLGHHPTTLAEDLPYDTCGLDGYLCVETRYTDVAGSEKRLALVHRVIPVVEKFFGFPAREINRDDWYDLLYENLSR